MLVRITNSEDPDQTASRSSLIWVCAVCLGLLGGHFLTISSSQLSNEKGMASFNSLLAILFC